MHFYAVHQMTVKFIKFDKIQLDLMDVHQVELVLQVMNTPLEILLTVKSKKYSKSTWRYGCRLLTQPIPHLPHIPHM